MTDIFRLENIDTSYNGYSKLIELYHKDKDKFFENITISFQKWFDANMCSPLGGILNKFTENLNRVEFEPIPTDIQKVLQKNGFLSSYGYEHIQDKHNTTIRYLKLKPTDGRYFSSYVMHELLDRQEFTSRSPTLKKKIAESIYEIFVNAQIHSQTHFIYTCGQFYPKRNRIAFTVTDTGIGFKSCINNRFKRNLTSIQAITWAIADGHSTKEGVPGGIGLALLKEFVIKNGGRIQIVSGDGFYQFDSGKVLVHAFQCGFPGSIINIEFRTDDNHHYILEKTKDSKDVF